RRARLNLPLRVELRLRRHELRQLIEDRLYADRARLLEALGADGDDRARCVEIAAKDPRAGHDDFLDALPRLLRVCMRCGKNCRNRRREQRQPTATARLHPGKGHSSPSPRSPAPYAANLRRYVY